MSRVCRGCNLLVVVMRQDLGIKETQLNGSCQTPTACAQLFGLFFPLIAHLCKAFWTCASINAQSGMCKYKCTSAKAQVQICDLKCASVNVQQQMCKRKMCKRKSASAHGRVQMCKFKMHKRKVFKRKRGNAHVQA